jgi:pimeloyl-ACP methyl ester carboxylesterase
MRRLNLIAPLLLMTLSVAALPLPAAQYTGSISVDAGGHSLHMLVEGQGSPTVILESGIGQGADAWSKVLPEVARLTRTVAYDRAGLGESEPGPKPRTAQQIAVELRTALKNAYVSPPYVLVGHSGSGFNIRVFASMYPREVVGMLFIDPIQEGLDDWLKSNRPEAWKEMQEQIARSAEGVRDEAAASEASMKQVQAARRLKGVPVILLTGGRTGDFRTPELLQAWQSLHKEWLKQVPSGKHILAEKSGHDIHQEEPELVINAIKEIVESARQKAQRN